jgi:hypothetical protein
VELIALPLLKRLSIFVVVLCLPPDIDIETRSRSGFRVGEGSIVGDEWLG